MFSPERTDLRLEVFLDNTCAFTYINNMRGRISTLNTTISDTWNWSKERNLWVVAKHVPIAQIPSAQNSITSRVFSGQTEWSLSSTAFNTIVARWETPDVAY